MVDNDEMMMQLYRNQCIANRTSMKEIRSVLKLLISNIDRLQGSVEHLQVRMDRIEGLDIMENYK